MSVLFVTVALNRANVRYWQKYVYIHSVLVPFMSAEHHRKSVCYMYLTTLTHDVIGVETGIYKKKTQMKKGFCLYIHLHRIYDNNADLNTLGTSWVMKLRVYLSVITQVQ